MECHCIDNWLGINDLNSSDNDIFSSEHNFDYNIKLTAANKKFIKIYKHKTDTLEIASKLFASGKRNYFDFVYISGCQEPHALLTNAALLFRLLKIDGLLGFDQYLSYFSTELNTTFNIDSKTSIDSFINTFYKKIEIIPKINSQLFIRKISD